jgi:hypothetical protein
VADYVPVAEVEVRTTEGGEFFVFNDDDDPDGRGFRLCKFCSRVVTEKTTGRGRAKTPVVEKHRTPEGRDCAGTGYDLVHLGHEFRTSAARLNFRGTGRDPADKSFWPSLLHAVLGGLTDALGVDTADVKGVTRPVGTGGGGFAAEVVVFDDVPGGAGHALRLATEGELRHVLKAALRRVEACDCGRDAPCYGCRRSYRNQGLHPVLARGPVADYLTTLATAV